jgi:hypothetical protein
MTDTRLDFCPNCHEPMIGLCPGTSTCSRYAAYAMRTAGGYGPIVEDVTELQTEIERLDGLLSQRVAERDVKIERLRADNERLRAALKDALMLAGVWDDSHPILQRARRALEEEEEK